MGSQQHTPDVNEFKEHMLNFYQYGHTLTSLILGYDLGIFEVLHRAEGPLTQTELADRTDLKERYVQEWLGAVTAANVISVHEINGINRYNLPKEYFDILMSNIAFSKGVCECVRRLDDIKMCFQKQGPMVISPEFGLGRSLPAQLELPRFQAYSKLCNMDTKRNILDAENFKEHIQKFYKYGYTMMSLILGYDLGLFDVLHKAERALTATEIAEQADLKERYVKEWLGAVTAANVISVHEDNGVNRYALPTEYYDTLIANIALCKGVSECVKRVGFIKECFKRQGPMGDPHAFDGEFWKFFGEFRDECLVTKQLQNELFPKLESVEELRNLLDEGCDVIDIGCGNGALTSAFGSQYPNSSFTGIDTDEKSITEAKEKLESLESECRNIQFRLESTTDLVQEVGEHYDVVLMFQALHNLPDPIKMIKEVNDILKPGGKLVLIEMKLHSNHLENVDNLCASAQYSFSQFFCLPFSMSDKPHLGFGMGWGEENLLAELRKFLKLDARFEHGDFETLFVLSKTKGMTYACGFGGIHLNNKRL